MISGVIHCFIATVHTVMSQETAIRATAFRCGQNIRIIKYEIENTNILLKE